MKIRAYDLMAKLFAIYLFAILFYRVIPIKLTIPIGFIMILDLIYIYIKHLTKNRVYLFLYLLFIIIYTSSVTDNIGVNFSDFVRVATVFLLMGIMVDTKEVELLRNALSQNAKLFRGCAQIASIATLIFLFLPACYASEGTWGESNRYFLGFSETFHINASCMCLCIAMYLLGIHKKKFKVVELFYLVPPLLAIFQSGARVYLICAICLFGFYYFERLSKVQIKVFVFPAVCIAGIYYLLNSNMMEKFLYTQSNYVSSNTTMLDSMTSGRLGFWSLGIRGFSDSNLMYKLFGHGFNYIRVLTTHSGHNDVMHMLLGIGLVGCFVYLLYIIRAILATCKRIKTNDSRKFIRVVYIVSVFAYVFAPLIFNGLFGYQHLLYSIIILMVFMGNNTIRKEGGDL